MKRINYSKELLEEAIKNVFTYSDVCRKLGLYPNSGNIKTLHHKFSIYNIDVSHFLYYKNNSDGTKRSLNSILVEDSNYLNTDCLRRRIIKEGLKSPECEICGIKEWMGKPISFQLHHINGIKKDNRLSNLQILCPNCHSQTYNFKNKK